MVEVVPFALEALVAFSALCGLLVASGLLAAWGHTFGFLFQWLGNHARISTHIHYGVKHIDLGGPFRKVDHIVYSALQAWRDGAEIEFSWSLHKMAQTYEWTAEAIDYLTRETAETFDRLWHIGLPKWAKWAALAALPPLLLTKLIAQAVAHLRPEIVKTIRYVDHAVPQTVNQVFKMAAGALPYPPWIIHLPRRIGNLERDVRTLRKALSNPKALIGAVAGAAIMANSLGLGNNWRCVTRGNIGKTARALCGLPTHLLNDLLGVLADVWILENVCVLLPILERGAADIGAPLVSALTDVTAGLCKGSIGAAKPLQGPMPVVPPVTYGTSLVAV